MHSFFLKHELFLFTSSYFPYYAAQGHKQLTVRALPWSDVILAVEEKDSTWNTTAVNAVPAMPGVDQAPFLHIFIERIGSQL